MALKFIDFFAGVGGFRKGLEMAGHKCVGFIEWDKFARQSYQAIFETEGEYTENDIRAVKANELPRSNVWCFGFPCQDISVSGKQEGFDGERSSLFFGVTKLIRELKKEDKPELLFIENVKNLLSVNDGFDFLRLQVELDEIGYNLEWDVLNSKYFGVPQNRERAFIIGHLRGKYTRKVFPFRGEENSAYSEQPKINIVGSTKGEHQTSHGQKDIVYGLNGITGALTATDYKQPKQIAVPVNAPNRHGVMVVGNLPGNHDQNSRVYSDVGISPTLTTMQGGGQEPKIIQKGRGFNKGGEHDIAPTLTSNSYHENNMLKIKEATKKGFSEAAPGDSVNISHPKSKTRRGRVGSEIANTLLTGEEQAVVTDDFQIRKLTPLECWRLQGWEDEMFYRAKFGSKEIARRIITEGIDHYNCEFEQTMSDSQLYKQAGNGVTVTVIYEIAKGFSDGQQIDIIE